MSGFFKRWSTLKTENAVHKVPVAEEIIHPEESQNTNSSVVNNPLSETEENLPKETEASGVTPSGPKLADVENLTSESDFSVFVKKDVAGEVHHAAMKKLFADPHFNIMDGLDIYIDDYSIEDPLPAGMLEKMYQSDALGLFKPLLATAEPNPTELIVPTDSTRNLPTDSPVNNEVTSDILATNTSLISHQEQFEFTMSNSIEPTESVEQESIDLTNTEVNNKDDHTRL